MPIYKVEISYEFNIFAETSDEAESIGYDVVDHSVFNPKTDELLVPDVLVTFIDE